MVWVVVGEWHLKHGRGRNVEALGLRTCVNMLAKVSESVNRVSVLYWSSSCGADWVT